MVCIIDDREDVWDYASNLIHVKPYHFFQHTGDIHAPPGLDKCETDDGKQGYDFSEFNNESRIGEEINYKGWQKYAYFILLKFELIFLKYAFISASCKNTGVGQKLVHLDSPPPNGLPPEQ